MLVSFSENLSADSVQATNFSISGFTIASTEIPHGGNYNEVLLTLSSNLISDAYYVVMVSGVEAYSENTL